jgi:hypothetical protein
MLALLHYDDALVHEYADAGGGMVVLRIQSDGNPALGALVEFRVVLYVAAADGTYGALQRGGEDVCMYSGVVGQGAILRPTVHDDPTHPDYLKLLRCYLPKLACGAYHIGFDVRLSPTAEWTRHGKQPSTVLLVLPRLRHKEVYDYRLDWPREVFGAIGAQGPSEPIVEM